VQQDACSGGEGREREMTKKNEFQFDIVVSSASKEVNCQTERNAEIKYDKNTRK